MAAIGRDAIARYVPSGVQGVLPQIKVLSIVGAALGRDWAGCYRALRALRGARRAPPQQGALQPVVQTQVCRTRQTRPHTGRTPCRDVSLVEQVIDFEISA